MMSKKKDGELPIDLGGKRKQQKIDGSGTLKETTPKDVQAAADVLFSKKADFACSKSNLEKAAEEMLAVMGKHKVTQVKVFDNEGYPKRIIIRAGAEKLKVENTVE
jgi:hypothetical protein